MAHIKWTRVEQRQQRSTKSDWVIQVVALDAALPFILFFFPLSYVSLWTISFPERNTLHAHIQLVIVHSVCNALLQRFSFLSLFHPLADMCLSPLVRSRVMYYIFIYFFCSRSHCSVLSAIVNYVHNMYVVMWVYGFNTMPCFFVHPTTNMNVNCRKRKRWDRKPVNVMGPMHLRAHSHGQQFVLYSSFTISFSYSGCRCLSACPFFPTNVEQFLIKIHC